MSDATQELPPSDSDAQARRLLSVWSAPRGWRYWSEVNNTEVGVWYTVTAGLFFLYGGVLALLMRVQLAVPENDFMSADLYNQVFTLHGSVMMFLFAVPIFEAISILILPQMLGARDLPFPRLSAFGFYCFLIGGVFVCGSLLFGAAPKGGWFMYPPMTTKYQPGIGADIWLLGLSFIEIASIAAAVELIVGVLKCRPPGMRINLIPLYAWYILVVAGMILFAFPPLIAGDILLEMERAFDWPFFDPSRGGDPLLWQHLFWIFGHPEVYIVFLPSVALMAMIVPTFSRTPIVGYGWVVLAAVGTGFLSFGLWVHHMFTTGLPGVTLGIFSAASLVVAIPTGIQFFCFLATLMTGRVIGSVPLMFVFASLVTFVFGGLTGVMVAVAPFDFQAHDTFFVVGHLHYVLVGGTIFPIVAGLYYYYPFATGKHLSSVLGKIAFWLLLAGFNMAFMPMHWTGLLGMPRRVYTYSPGLGFDTLNMVSTIGAFILGVGFLVVLWDLVRPKGHQPFASRNPWNAGTLEWLAEMPLRPWGIRSIPTISSRYPLWEQEGLMEDVDQGKGYLPDAEEGYRETLITSVIDARPIQCLRVPGPSFLPMICAAFTGAVFIFATFHWWTTTAAMSVVAFVALLAWLWTGTAEVPEKETKHVGLGLDLPIYVSGPAAVGWWAMFITMLADITAFVSLVFGYFFYWTIHQDFPPETSPNPNGTYLLTGGLLLLLAYGLTLSARYFNRTDKAFLFYAVLVLASVLTALGTVVLVAGPYGSGLDPTRHAYEAIVWLLVGWTAVHAAVGILMQLYCLARRIGGKTTPVCDADIVNVVLYWHFLALTVLLTVCVVAGFPQVA